MNQSEQLSEIIICDCDHKDVNAEANVIRQAGYHYKWLHCRSQEEVIHQCQGATCLLNQYVKMDWKVFEALPSLRQIVRYGVGVDTVNLEDATNFGIQVCNVPDYGTSEVADHALALMLALTRKIYKAANLTAQGIWEYARTIPIRRFSELTVGVLGTGRIGTSFAKKVEVLGCRVIAYDSNYDVNNPRFLKSVTYQNTLYEMLEQADIVSIHCSLDDKSQNIMNAAAFEHMKNGAYLINVSRGGLVDESALEEALNAGKLAGAALDVVKTEPLDANCPLMMHDNVIITPHMAWYSEESALELKRKCAEEAVRFLKGKSVHYPVNDLKRGETEEIRK